MDQNKPSTPQPGEEKKPYEPWSDFAEAVVNVLDNKTKSDYSRGYDDGLKAQPQPSEQPEEKPLRDIVKVEALPERKAAARIFMEHSPSTEGSIKAMKEFAAQEVRIALVNHQAQEQQLRDELQEFKSKLPEGIVFNTEKRMKAEKEAKELRDYLGELVRLKDLNDRIDFLIKNKIDSPNDPIELLAQYRIEKEQAWAKAKSLLNK